jgi:hypothetical protein
MTAFAQRATDHRDRRDYWLARARQEPELRRTHVAFARAAHECFKTQRKLARRFAQ